jgi:hypothetical protein
MFTYTPQISTGDVSTVIDTRDTAKFNNNAQNPLGIKFYDASDPLKAYRYVRYNSTANPDVQAGPAAVWWTDNTFTTVTSTVSEALAANFFAGVMLLNTGQATGPFKGKTGAQAKALLNGNFIIIQVTGHVAGCLVAASTAAGDFGLATQSDWTTTGGFSRIAAGAAVTNRIAFFAETAVSNNKSDVFVMAENG